MNEKSRSLLPRWGAWIGAWVLLALGSHATGLNAQAHPVRPKVSDEVAWSGNAWAYVPFDPSKDPVLESAPGNRTRVQRPAGALEGNGWSIRDGVLYFVSTVPGDKDVHLYRSEMDASPRAWSVVGSFTSIKNGWAPANVIPLEDGKRFLGFSHMDSGFMMDGSASCAAIFRLSGNEFLIDALVDMPFEGKATIWRFVPGAKPSSPMPSSQAPMLGACEPLSPVLEPSLMVSLATPDYAFLAATHTGVIWAFSLKDGHCVKAINLGGFAWDSLGSAGLIENFILGVQPDRDGNLVVATRSPEISTIAKVLYVDPATSPEAAKRAREDFSQAVQAMGDVQWWIVDSKTLEAKPVSTGAYPEIKGSSYARLNHFKFLIDPDNQIFTSLGGHWNEFLEQLAHPPPRAGDPAPAQKKAK